MESRNDDKDLLAFVALVVAGTVLALSDCGVARAQGYSPPPVDQVFPVPTEREVFLLSKIALHETSGLSQADHAAIYEVLAGKARRAGTSLVVMMRRHSARATCTSGCTLDPTSRSWPRSTRTQWIQELRMNGDRPRSYRDTTPWPVVRALWFEVIAYSRLLLMGWARSQCVAEPEDWGCERHGCNDIPAYFREYRDRLNRRPCRVDCGESSPGVPTLNTFLRRNGGC